MAILRSRKAVLLAGIEDVEGVAETLSASTDAVLVENLKLNINGNIISTNEVSNSLDGFGDIIGGIKIDVSFDVLLKGSGAAGTPPESGKLLKACGWAEVITATAVPASAEACAAGGTTTSAVLGTSASATAQVYRGMPVNLSTGVSGLAFITDYTTGKVATVTDTLGGSPDAGTNYQIPVNVVYKPASDAIPSLTFDVYMDGQLYTIAGARGNMKFGITSSGIGKMSFDFKGMFISKTDATLPIPTYDSSRPPVYKVSTVLMDRKVAAINSFNFDMGNTLTQPENPNAQEGYDPTEITGRKMTGSMDPKETLVATRDIMADFRAGTKRILHSRYGTATGNKVAITIPQALYKGQTPGDREGMMTVDVPFEAVGQDAGAFICFY